MMLKFKANWVDVPDADSPEGPGYKHFQVCGLYAAWVFVPCGPSSTLLASLSWLTTEALSVVVQAVAAPP